jgi:hypothetical protein
MKFQTHNDKNVDCGGTHLQGEIVATFADLKKKFGKPTESDGYKSDAEWEVEFENGVVATIYNWKNGKNYCGASGIAKTKITNWHVGGASLEAVRLVKQALQS